MSAIETTRTRYRASPSQPQRNRWLVWSTRLLLGLLVSLMVLAGIGGTYQAIATARDQRTFPLPGKLVDVGGYRLHIHCTGQALADNPTVILLDGLPSMSAIWANVQSDVAQITRVCAYDRAGGGWSDPGPKPRDAQQIAGELHTLLAQAEIAGPYVLVGHSFGGLYARMYAGLYTGKLVKQATLRRAFKPYTLRNGQSTGYGYGWVIGNYEGHPIAEHNGGINGFHTQVMRLPADKVYAAILTNMDNPPVDPGDLAFTIVAMVIGKPYQDPTAITLPVSTLAAYEGVYLFNGQPTVVIRREGGHLTMQMGGPATVLRPFSANEFFAAGIPLRIKFAKNNTGEVNELKF